MNNRELKKLLEDGNKDKWDVCYQIAEYYYEHQEPQMAFFWYNKAALLPGCNPVIYFEIGYLYQHGEGVDIDFAEAVKWYEKAAAEDVPQAFYNLAYFYQNGLVVGRNPEKALQMLRIATASMRRLQVERFFYELWKEKSETQLARLHKENEVLHEQINSMEEIKQYMSFQSSEAICENGRLKEAQERLSNELIELKEQSNLLKDRAEKAEQKLEIEKNVRTKTEQLSSEYHFQMQNQLKAAENLIKKIVEDYNISHESIRKSYEAHIDKLKKIMKKHF